MSITRKVLAVGTTAALTGGALFMGAGAATAANDPGFFALHGIDLQPPLLLVVKAKNHFRAAFAALCTAPQRMGAHGVEQEFGVERVADHHQLAFVGDVERIKPEQFAGTGDGGFERNVGLVNE